MPRKTKQIQKEEKEEKPHVEAKKEKKKEQSNDWDIFSDEFKDRLNQFVSLNSEVSDLKSSVQGSDQSGQAAERKERMAGKVEEAAAAILRDELTSLEDWIKDQQKTLKEDIAKIEEAYENSRTTLVATGFFNESEVRDQLANIQKKADAKKEVYDNYDSLLARAKEIYS